MVAIAAAGMMATTAMQLAIDAFGPIADNAGGIAEMSELPKGCAENRRTGCWWVTTAATQRVLRSLRQRITALALFAAFVGHAGQWDQYLKAKVCCLFLWWRHDTFYLFLHWLSVRWVRQLWVWWKKCAASSTIPGIMEGTGKPDFEKCGDLYTGFYQDAAARCYHDISPLVNRFPPRTWSIGRFSCRYYGGGVLMGMFQNNAGGAWDNAKKSFERCVEINGEMYKKIRAIKHLLPVIQWAILQRYVRTFHEYLIKLMSIRVALLLPYLAQMEHKKLKQQRKKKWSN